MATGWIRQPQAIATQKVNPTPKPYAQDLMSNHREIHRQLHTADSVAKAFQVSRRQFYRLKRGWVNNKLLREGKHVFRLGKRGKRYDLDAMLQLARRHGYVASAE
jgi:hypothetical protein